MHFLYFYFRLRRAWHPVLNVYGYRIRKRRIWRSPCGCIVVAMGCVYGCRCFHATPIVDMAVDIRSCQNGLCFHLHWSSIHWPFSSRMPSYWVLKMIRSCIPAIQAHISRYHSAFSSEQWVIDFLCKMCATQHFTILILSSTESSVSSSNFTSIDTAKSRLQCMGDCT